MVIKKTTTQGCTLLKFVWKKLFGPTQEFSGACFRVDSYRQFKVDSYKCVYFRNINNCPVRFLPIQARHMLRVFAFIIRDLVAYCQIKLLFSLTMFYIFMLLAYLQNVYITVNTLFSLQVFISSCILLLLLLLCYFFLHISPFALVYFINFISGLITFFWKTYLSTSFTPIISSSSLTSKYFIFAYFNAYYLIPDNY